MNVGVSSSVGEAVPHDVWKTLEESPTAVLIDVRSAAEWSFVGGPDLSSLNKHVIQVEWASFPGMAKNSEFAAQVLDALGGAAPSHAFFICRSGARSLSAAATMAKVFSDQGKDVACVNVKEGFEGDLDSSRQRGRETGWKARGLSWAQS